MLEIHLHAYIITWLYFQKIHMLNLIKIYVYVLLSSLCSPHNYMNIRIILLYDMINPYNLLDQLSFKLQTY